MASFTLNAGNASQNTVADWVFDAPNGTVLEAVPDTVRKTKFSGPQAPGVNVDKKVLSVRKSLTGPAAFYAQLPAVAGDQPLWLVAELNGWHFVGRPGEYVAFGFTDNTDGYITPSPAPALAEARLSRLRPGTETVITGRASGIGTTMADGSKTGPVTEDRPTQLALYYEPHSATYAIFWSGENGGWELVGRGAIDEIRRPRYVRLAFDGLTNDTASEGVRIRRVSVRTAPPSGLDLAVLAPKPFISSPTWAIANAEGEMLAGEGIDTPVKIASINKTMTCYLICNLAEKEPAILDQMITCTNVSQVIKGSHSGLPSGDSLAVRDALYAMMLPSGNDIALLLADHFSKRFDPPAQPLATPTPITRVNFIAEMNRKAQELGMSSTVYRNPAADGGTAADRTSTVRDQLKLAQVAMKNALFRQVVGAKHHKAVVKKKDGSTRVAEWENTNHLLGSLGVNGIKTGTDVIAKACLLTSATLNGRPCYTVVLGSRGYGRRFVDTRNILEWAAKNPSSRISTSESKAISQPKDAKDASSEGEREEE